MEPFDYPDNDPGTADAAHLARRRPEHRPAALADEPLPGLCRHRQLHGRALHRLRAGAGAGAARGRQARPDLPRRRRPRRAASRARSPAPTTSPSPRPTSSSTRCRRRPTSTGRSAGLKPSRASAASRSALAGALPVSIDRIARWAKAAESRGILLVPITAVVAQGEVELTAPRTEARSRREPESTHPVISTSRVIPGSSAIRGAGSTMPRYESLPYRPCVGDHGDQPHGPRVHRQRRGRARARRRHAFLADAAGRRRSGRGHLRGGAARAARGDQHPLGREARRGRRNGSATTSRARSSARPGRASTAGRRRNGTRCASPARTARSTSPIRPAATSRNSWTGAGSDGQAAGADHSVQAAGLRAGGAGIREVRGRMSAVSSRNAAPAPLQLLAAAPRADGELVALPSLPASATAAPRPP